MAFFVLHFSLFVLLLGCQPVPLPQAHAHNDYLQKHPLRDALDCGFCSIEADIHLVDGELLVAHDREQVRRGRTLQSLYLDPLRARVRANGGRVYRGGSSVILLIDIKSEPTETYAVLRRVLQKYTPMLTRFEGAQTAPGAVTAMVTGKYPIDIIANEPTRYVACDGFVTDLETARPTELVPQVAIAWEKHFTWRGEGAMPAKDRAVLRDLVVRAHQQNRKIRFWGGPDDEAAWREMLSAGVDWINTDNLRGLRDFLLSQRGLYSQSSSRLPSGSAK
jgi:glycerophosphoryl diester phosphodiesterase